MSTQGHEKEAVNVEGLKAALKSSGNKAIYNEAICSTAGGTAAKVTNTVPPSFSLVSGAKILVKFTYAITVANATLQVGTNAAKPIFYHGAALAANLVKAGTSLLLVYDGTNFNIVGDINTDTTYQVMGASGSTHSGGLVPDTPSVAGTTKFLREDGTWQEPAGQNYSAGDGIDISNNEISADNTIARKTDLAPAKLGSGIGTCSTSSGTALEVVLSDYNLVQNGIVAVTFENDVPANATLNVNGKGAKPIYYKGSAIEADTIKADDTVMFCYDGSSYVVTSLGGGGAAPVNPNETVNISLTQVGGSSSDLIGAAITITDDDTSTTIFTGIWNGSIITAEIDVNTNYTVSVDTITGYLACAPQSYQASYQTERNISFQYRASGAFVEATDGILYTASTWASSGKTANSVVVITSSVKCRVPINYEIQAKAVFKTAPTEAELGGYGIYYSADHNNFYNGYEQTQKLITFNNAKEGSLTTDYAPNFCWQYTFPNGTHGYFPTYSELVVVLQNGSAINTCLEACGSSLLNLTDNFNYWCSTVRDANNGVHYVHGNAAAGYYYGTIALNILPIGQY